MILLVSPKTKYSTKRLIKEAAALGVPMEVLDSADLATLKFKIDPAPYRLLFMRFFDMQFLPQIKRLAEKFRRAGKKVLGNVTDKHLGKLKTSKLLQKHHLPVPKLYNLSNLKYPCVVKSEHGLGSQEVFLVKNLKELLSAAKKLASKSCSIQEYIEADFEYKVVTVGYKSIPVVLRFSISSKKFKPDPNKYKVLYTKNPSARKIVRLAEKASKITGRELAKVDILQKGAKLYILEVNRWPGLKAFEAFSKFNVAREFVKYLNESGRKKAE